MTIMTIVISNLRIPQIVIYRLLCLSSGDCWGGEVELDLLGRAAAGNFEELTQNNNKLMEI